MPDRSPWHDSSLTRWERFWGTVGQSMFRPGKLARGFPAQLSLAGSYLFVLLVYGLILSVGILPAMVFFWALATPGMGMGLRTGFNLLAILPVVLVGLTIYGAMCHGLLRVYGSTTGGIGRTIASMGFAFGPMVFAMLPCLGPYCLQYPAFIWVMISAILILTTAQGVSGLRASVAVLTPVLLFLVSLMALTIYVGVMANNVGTMAANPPAKVLTPGNTEPGPPLAIGDATARFRCSVIVDLVAGSEDLPTFEQLMENPEVLFHSSVEPLEPTSTAFRGVGYQGWWIPGMMVIKGANGAILVTLNEISGLSPEASESYSIFHWDRVEFVFAPPTSNQKIVDALRLSLAEVGGDWLPASTVDEWVAASVSREVDVEIDTLKVGRSKVKIDQSSWNRLFSDYLPEIDQLIVNSQDVVQPAKDGVSESKPDRFESEYVRGWWVPNLLVVRGELDALVVTCIDRSQEDDLPVDGSIAGVSRSPRYRITKEIDGIVVSTSYSRQQIGDALKQRITMLDPEDNSKRIEKWIDDWLDASGRSSGPEWTSCPRR